MLGDRDLIEDEDTFRQTRRMEEIRDEADEGGQGCENSFGGGSAGAEQLS